MENFSVENVEDIVEKNEKMTGNEFLQRCQLLEDVETSMLNPTPQGNVNTKIKYRYTKDELLKLRTHPLSTKPLTLQENLKFLLGTGKSKERDESDLKKLLKKPGITRNLEAITEKVDSKKNDSPRNGEKLMSRNESIDESRKPADPKERIRKEQDICLSPQRKSFNTGCYVAPTKNETPPNNTNKTNTENAGREPRENRETRERENRESRENRDTRDNKNFREVNRRIGSGRIISRDPRFEIRGYPDSSPSFDHQYNRSFSMNKEIPTVVYERRFQNNSFDREKDNKMWDRQRTYNNYDKRRSHDRDDEEEEPEWMKEGPVSLDDVIELKGFDENDEKYFRNRNSKINTRIFHKSFTNNVSNKSTTNGRPRSDKRNSDSDNSSVASDSMACKNNENSPDKSVEKTDDGKKSSQSETKEKDDKPVENSIQFNLEEILKLDPLPDMAENADNESAGSKFTRWFKRDETHANGDQNQAVPRHSIIFNSTNAANVPAEFMKNDTNPHSGHHSVPASNLLDLLRGSQDNSTPAKMDMCVLEASGKLHSLEEIEAKLRGTDTNQSGMANGTNDKKKKEEEAEAFKKLLSQAFHIDKSQDGSTDSEFSQKMSRNEAERKLDLNSVLCNGDNHANFTNVQPQHGRIPPQVNMQPEMLKLLQLQQNKQQQEMLSKMLSNSSSSFSVPPPGNVRPPSAVSYSGPFPFITPEIQVMINDVQPTRELMQRMETVNIIRALKSGEVSHYQLVEQLKKTSHYQSRFRESLLCVLKMVQMQYYNSAPVLGSPAGMSFNIPPPPPPVQTRSENILRQMMMNSQYCANGPHNGMPNVVYQREFSSPNQNVYQNNVIKKHLAEQSSNIGQNVARMSSPTTVLSSPVSVPVSGNVVNAAITSPNDKSNMPVSKSTSTTQSLSFTPTSVLRKLSAEKENMDTFSKEAAESKGEKNTVLCNSAGGGGKTIDHLGYGSCIPPPAISGQYFVGNMIRPANISSQVPIFGSPPPVLSRLAVCQEPKVSPSTSQLQQLQMRNSNTQLAQMIMNSNFSANTRKQTDSNLPLAGFGNQNLPSRNGNLTSAEEQMARWFSTDGVNQSRSAMAQNIGMPTASLQNMMSVDEIERVQQSVRN